MYFIGAKQAFPLPATERSCPLAPPGLLHWCQGSTATGEGSVATATAATRHPVLLATNTAAVTERYAGERHSPYPVSGAPQSGPDECL